MRITFTTIVMLFMFFGAGCKKDPAPTCEGMKRCCALLKKAGKGADAQSLYCGDLDKEKTCQIQLPRFLQKIKDERTRSMCSKAINEVIFKKE